MVVSAESVRVLAMRMRTSGQLERLAGDDCSEFRSILRLEGPIADLDRAFEGVRRRGGVMTELKLDPVVRVRNLNACSRRQKIRRLVLRDAVRLCWVCEP